MDGKLDQLQGAVDSGGVSLATDTVLNNILGEVSESITQRASALMKKVDSLGDCIQEASVEFGNTHNQFMLLSNTQFMEHRVYDDDAEVIAESKVPSVVYNSAELTEARKNAALVQAKEALKFFIPHVEEQHASASEADLDAAMAEADMFGFPLPFVIGTERFLVDPTVGLGDEEPHDEGDLQPAPEDVGGGIDGRTVAAAPVPAQPGASPFDEPATMGTGSPFDAPPAPAPQPASTGLGTVQSDDEDDGETAFQGFGAAGPDEASQPPPANPLMAAIRQQGGRTERADSEPAQPPPANPLMAAIRQKGGQAGGASKAPAASAAPPRPADPQADVMAAIASRGGKPAAPPASAAPQEAATDSESDDEEAALFAGGGRKPAGAASRASLFGDSLMPRGPAGRRAAPSSSFAGGGLFGDDEDDAELLASSAAPATSTDVRQGAVDPFAEPQSAPPQEPARSVESNPDARRAAAAAGLAAAAASARNPRPTQGGLFADPPTSSPKPAPKPQQSAGGLFGDDSGDEGTAQAPAPAPSTALSGGLFGDEPDSAPAPAPPASRSMGGLFGDDEESFTAPAAPKPKANIGKGLFGDDEDDEDMPTSSPATRQGPIISGGLFDDDDGGVSAPSPAPAAAAPAPKPATPLGGSLFDDDDTPPSSSAPVPPAPTFGGLFGEEAPGGAGGSRLGNLGSLFDDDAAGDAGAAQNSNLGSLFD